MPRSPRRPAQLAGRVFPGPQAVALGLLTPGELRSSAWRAIFRGVYVDARLRVTHLTRCAAAARWLLPAAAAVAGRSAVALYGGIIPGDAVPVEVLAGKRFGPVRGLRVHSGDIDPQDITHHRGVRVTAPARTCWDLAQWLDVVEAVAHVDSLLQRHMITLAELADYAARRSGDRGRRRLARVIGLADPGAASPPESRTRVRLVLAGLPKPVTQHVIESGGRFVGRVDLAWPDFKVAVEYDGAWHGAEEQLHRDRRRLNRLLGEGWIVLHVTARRLHEDFEGFAAEVRAALRSRGWRRARRSRVAMPLSGTRPAGM